MNEMPQRTATLDRFGLSKAWPAMLSALKQPKVLTGGLLVLITVAGFYPILENDFVNFDDYKYVVKNPHVVSGLNWDNVCWAFRTGYATNWHPLTWISHMLDVQVFGLRPEFHHLTSLLLHLANVLLLYRLLLRVTGAWRRSALAAALFAVHPLHVESVAWIAERKDVLSTFFFLLTLGFYCRYARQTAGFEPADPSAPATNSIRLGDTARPYLLSLISFALGLMSKPMLVTTPFVLLLLDYWPLNRLSRGTQRPSFGTITGLVLEKAPFLLMAAVASVVTLFVQTAGHATTGFPLNLRVENAVISYLKYLGKTVWPTHLSVFYPHPNLDFFSAKTAAVHWSSEQWPIWTVIGAIFVFLAATVVAGMRRRSQPWLLVGWFWFLGTLVPVIGLVQVGKQAMADRYTYIPLIGIFVAFVWWLGETLRKLSAGRVLGGATGVLLIAACVLGTQNQSKIWRNNLTLFEHALKVTSGNALAHCYVGEELVERRKFGLGQAHLRMALLIDPNCEDAHANLGYLFELDGKLPQAIREYQICLQLTPWDDLSRCHIASMLNKLGRHDEAVAQYQTALRYNPDNADAYYALGTLQFEGGDLEAAAGNLTRAIQILPGFTDALLCLSDVRVKQGRLAEAEAALRQLARRFPKNAELRVNLGGIIWQRGNANAALEEYFDALGLDPNQPLTHYNVGVILSGQGRVREALSHFEEAVRLKPDYAEALLNLAWILATNPKAEARDGQRAVSLAKRALELTDGRQTKYWAALDTALAESGQFTAAISAAEKARDLAEAAGQTNLVQSATARLELYRAQKPFHQ